MRIVVTGSLAYDYLMSFPGLFRDHILPDKVHMLTVSFLVDSMQKLRGGTAGNIAYTLGLLGAHPLVVSAAGNDFGEYRAWMDRHGVDSSGVVAAPDVFTASCFINTDQANNQIVAFYAGAMAHGHLLTLDGKGLGADDLVVISPTDVPSMMQMVRDCQRLGIPYVFDPGKQTPRLEAADILLGIEKAAVLVGNDYEFAMMAQKTERPEADLIHAAPLAVVTRGELGSTFYVRGAAEPEWVIPVAPVSEVADPTGAGDAFLGGLLLGLSRKVSYPVAGRLGAVAAAYARDDPVNTSAHACSDRQTFRRR